MVMSMSSTKAMVLPVTRGWETEMPWAASTIASKSLPFFSMAAIPLTSLAKPGDASGSILTQSFAYNSFWAWLQLPSLQRAARRSAICWVVMVLNLRVESRSYPDMRRYFPLPVLVLVLCAFGHKTPRFPYKQAGLTERQAAAHLLSRFTYGATPGQVDAVVHMGLERWFSKQLEAGLAEDTLNRLLSGYDALDLTNAQVRQTFPRQGEILKMGIKDGAINADSAKNDPKSYRDLLKTYMQEKGYKPIQELYRQFYCQKVLRAAYTNNQLQEVMTDFWFNHFNVSVTKGDCAEFIPAYERDVIRPNALGNFGDLLLATAKSPAMLYYLDNFSSTAPLQDSMAMPARRARGLNENYAREVMELHTLGVDGGY